VGKRKSFPTNWRLATRGDDEVYGGEGAACANSKKKEKKKKMERMDNTNWLVMIEDGGKIE